MHGTLGNLGARCVDVCEPVADVVNSVGAFESDDRFVAFDHDDGFGRALAHDFMSGESQLRNRSRHLLPGLICSLSAAGEIDDGRQAFRLTAAPWRSEFRQERRRRLGGRGRLEVNSITGLRRKEQDPKADGQRD